MAGGTAEKTQSYTPIHCTRSDGMTYDYGNAVDEKTNTKSCEDPAIDARWRIHLGGYLKRELATGKDIEKDYILDALPEGYELRLTNANSDKKDYAIFGHPYGRNCRFRTSGEFAVHLLWLCSESTDWEDCSCDWCGKLVETMKQRQTQIVGGITPFTAAKTPTPNPHHSVLPSARTSPAQAGPSQSGSAWGKNSLSSAQKVTSSTPVVPPVPVISQASAIAQAPVISQGPVISPVSVISPAPAVFPAPAIPRAPAIPPAPVILAGTTGPCSVFRISEMVWYKLNAAWRLGVIIDIQARDPTNANGDDNAYAFQLAPLGHYLLQQPLQAKLAEEMRPFLTFSVPNTQLAELQNKSFTHVDWEAFVTQWAQDPVPEKANHKKQVVGLEASKMAAKCVNNAFSTFNRHSQAAAPTGAVETPFNGVFFGAEMIHVGDPVRVTGSEANGGFTCVMRVAEIIVTESPTGAALHFRGGVYRLNATPPGQQAFTVDPEQLGPAFVEEIRSRHDIMGDQGVTWGWVLLEQDAVRAEHDVQGRFYVTHRLMKILAPEKYEEAMQTKSLEDQQQSLNNRGHSNGAPWMGRQSNRSNTFGASVGVTMVLPPGIVEN